MYTNTNFLNQINRDCLEQELGRRAGHLDGLAGHRHRRRHPLGVGEAQEEKRADSDSESWPRVSPEG